MQQKMLASVKHTIYNLNVQTNHAVIDPNPNSKS